MIRRATNIIAFLALGALLQACLVVHLAKNTNARWMLVSRAWVLIPPDGNPVWATAQRVRFGRVSIESHRYDSQAVRDGMVPSSADWAAISVSSSAYDSVQRHFDGFIADAFLQQKRRQSSAQLALAQLPAWTRLRRLDRQSETATLTAPGVELSAEVGYGWPFVAASLRWTHTSAGTSFEDAVGRRTRAQPHRGMIPTRMYWPGAIGNSIVFGALLLIIWRLGVYIIHTRPQQWIREERLRLGRCPQCGYNLQANTTGVCPECGREAHP